MDNKLLWISEQITKSANVISRTKEICSNDILSAAESIIFALKKGNKIFWCGNGGSAGQAQHLSAELVCGLRVHQRKALASIALSTDTSVITAWSNDIDYKSVFSRQIEALSNAGDILVSLSTSGNSENVISAINVAKKLDLFTVGMTGGNKNKMVDLCDLSICIPSNDTQKIQEAHIMAGHLICELVENSFIN